MNLIIVGALFIPVLVERTEAMAIPIDVFTLIEGATFIDLNLSGATSASGGGVTTTGTPSNARVLGLGSSAGPTPSDPGDGGRAFLKQRVARAP